MQLVIETLGRESVVLEGKPVPWPSRASRDLFFLLLAHPRGITRAAITGKLWGSSDTPEANNSFKVTQYRLRRAFGDPGVTTEQDGRFSLAPVYYQNADHVQFQEALRQARTAENREGRLRAAYRALSLYGGDFLPDNPSDWAEETRTALRAAYVRARLDAAALHCDAVECHAAVRNLASGLGADPLVGEHHHRSLMTCLCTLGRTDDAISHYRHFLAFIQGDVGDTPTRATLHLADQIRNGEPHAAQRIGAPLPCPRRVLYGTSTPSDSPRRPLDLTHWETEVQRGRQMLALMQRLRGARNWPALAEGVQTFLGPQLRTPYVWLVRHDPARRGAQTAEPDLDGTGWPAPVIAALRSALGGALAPREEKPASPPFPEGSGLEVTVHPIGAQSQPPQAWLCIARSDGGPTPTSGDAELVDRVVGALGYVLSQGRWSSP